MHFTYFESFGLVLIITMVIFLAWNIRKALRSSPQQDTTEVPRFWRIVPQTLITPPPLDVENHQNHLIHISGRVRSMGHLPRSRGSLQITVLKWVQKPGKPYLRVYKMTGGSRYHVKGDWIYFTIHVEAYTMSPHVYFPVATIGPIEFDEPSKK